MALQADSQKTEVSMQAKLGGTNNGNTNNGANGIGVTLTVNNDGPNKVGGFDGDAQLKVEPDGKNGHGTSTTDGDGKASGWSVGTVATSEDQELPSSGKGVEKGDTDPGRTEDEKEYDSYFGNDYLRDDREDDRESERAEEKEKAKRYTSGNTQVPNGLTYDDVVARDDFQTEQREVKTLNKHIERRRRARGGGGLLVKSGRRSFAGESNRARRSTDINERTPLATSTKSATTSGRALRVQAGIELSPRDRLINSALGARTGARGTAPGLSRQQVENPTGNRLVGNVRVSNARALNQVPTVILDISG